MYDGGSAHWHGQTPVPGCLAGGALELILQCSSPPLPAGCSSFSLTGSCRAGTGSGLIGQGFPSSCRCAPFQLNYTGLTVQPGPGSCCPNGGQINVQINP
jgi:hypothetical protein